MSTDPEQSLPDLRYVRELAKVFKQYGLDELEIESGAQRVLLRRGAEGLAGKPVQVLPASTSGDPSSLTNSLEPSAGATQSPAVVVSPSEAKPLASNEDSVGTEPTTGEFITSPFVGTFYRAPRPELDPFVSVGTEVKAGQTICIIEAMKLFNEIEAEFSAVIEEVLVESGQAVEYGAKLFRIRRL